jgi:hypothetical protein
VLRGRFGDTTGRPYLEGRLLLPTQGVQLDISFLVDTGADKSMLMPGDGLRSTLDYGKLTGNEWVGGISGAMSVFTEQAAIVFTEPGKKLYMYMLNIHIAPASPETMDCSSLLGRDILDNWEMLYRPTTGQLLFDVKMADMTLPISKKGTTD